MKKIMSFVIAVILSITMVPIRVSAQEENRANKEMRAAWIATVWNLDWPNTTNNIVKQKEEYINLIDTLKDAGLNAVIVQVRPKSDAMYKSDINPWSEFLTGTQGKDPGYDPLQFMIEETHKRGMEFHAWFNPYRLTTGKEGTDLSKLAPNNPGRMNPSWVVSDGTNLYYDPGNPEVRKYLVDTVNEVVRNYDIDGVHFDDYFYKGSFNDDGSYKLYGNGMDKGDWRRNNVNLLVKDVYANIKAIKPKVQFGISPFAIWKNQKNDPNGSNTNGKQSYYDDYADSVAWVKNGWVDYIAPQVYWEIGHPLADYATLVEWWANQVRGTNVNLYIGQGVSNSKVARQITTQVNLNRQYKEIGGSIYYSAKNIKSDPLLHSDLKNLYSSSTENPEPPIEPSIVESKQLIGINRYETSVKVSQEGWKDGSNTVFLVNGYGNADGLAATPLAASYNAPILLTEKGYLDDYTKKEIIRLNPTQVFLIGGPGVLSDNIGNEIKGINKNINVTRIGGINRYETSLAISRKLGERVDVTKAYLCNGYGEADALSIAAKAGEEKAPIILTDKSKINEDTFKWLANQGLETAYFIGGEGILSNDIIEQVNKITSLNVSSNRVWGINRYETNNEVIRKFYPNEKQSSIIVAQGNILADALTSGPFAAKLNSPVVLVSTSLSKTQEELLNTKTSNFLYEIGGGINSNIIEKIKMAVGK